MAEPVQATYSVSVRDLVSFAWRSGNLGGTGAIGGRNRAVEGTRGHQYVQKQRPARYESEVSIEKTIETPDFSLQVRGRIDGLLVEGGNLLIEEIKTTYSRRIPNAEILHIAQARIYAWLYAEKAYFDSIIVQVTYFELRSKLLTEFKAEHSRFELETFFQQTVDLYLQWLRELHQWREERDASIQTLTFPHSAYRPGQRNFAVATYKTIKSGGRLFAEAPTGTGKTISVLFPAIKALPATRHEKIFYLTAKTSGRNVARDTVAALRKAGLKLRSLTLTAREKICFKTEATCDVQACPYAIGYYDRVRAAVREVLCEPEVDRTRIEQVARKHLVCPHELSLDVSEAVDLVICDYNHVFDPRAKLKRYFGDEKGKFTILVDESHNLIDRAREMYSAQISTTELIQGKNLLDAWAPDCAATLIKLRDAIQNAASTEEFVERGETKVRYDFPKEVLKFIDDFLDAAEQLLVSEELPFQKHGLLDLYFKILAFEQIVAFYSLNFVTLWDGEEQTLKIVCLDAANFLAKSLEGQGAGVFFSATLRPNEFFREALGGLPTDPTLELSSPFDPARLRLLVQGNIATNWKQRESTIGEVAHSIGSLVGQRTGNYLAFFPSYKYLTAVCEKLKALYPGLLIQAQAIGMDEAERDAFLAQFQQETQQSILGLAVMGGVFGEGIDLTGDRLIGAIIVGVGLPQLTLERDLIKEYYVRNGKSGFDFAYTFPGMTKVLQAAGRVIRSEKDRGVVLLIDERFRRPAYRKLFPPWWQPRFISSAREIEKDLASFWSEILP